MTKTVSYIKATIVRGIFFLIPLGLIVVVIEKILHWTQKLIHIFIRRVPEQTIIGLTLYDIIGVLILAIFCFAAGILARTRFGKKCIGDIEHRVLCRIPGYSFLIKIGQSILRPEYHADLPVVLAKYDDYWQIGFLMDQIDEAHSGVDAATLINTELNPWKEVQNDQTRPAT
jgi:uncharacterized membrane protein